MRRNIVVFIVLVFLQATGVSCPAGEEPPRVAASIHPVADLLARLAGSDFRTNTLFGPGTHPRASGATKTHFTDNLALYVRIGGAFEGTSDARETAAAARVLDLAAGLELMGESAGEQVERSIFAAALGAETDAGNRHNPWFWLDPRAAREAVDLMAAALAEVRPAAADRIQRRADLLGEDLLRLDEEIAEMIAASGTAPFAVFTTAWSYFARRYGLREVHLSSVVPGGGPGRHSLKGAAARLREAGTGRAFTDLTFPLAPARAVTARAGGELVVLHPLGREEKPGGYFSLLRAAAEAVAGRSR